MKRIYRLQSIGSSLYVALPKDWLEKFGLRKGLAVEIFVDNDGFLKIKPLSVTEEHEKIRKVKFTVSDPRGIYNTLIAAYLQGIDIIELRFNKAMERTIRESIERARNTLLGLEVMSEEENAITLQVFSSIHGDVKELIRNMSKIARSMYLDVAEALLSQDLSLVNSIRFRDDNLNRLYFYTVRTIRKQLTSSALKENILRLTDFRIVAKVIEEIGDEAKHGASIVLEILCRGFNIDVNNLNNLKNCVRILDTLYQEVIRKALSTGFDVVELYEIMVQCNELLDKLAKRKNVVHERPITLPYLLAEIYAVYEAITAYIYDIASLALTPL